MKFNDGHWRLLPGVQAIYPVTVVDVQVEQDALIVTGYDRAVHHRAAYLDGASIVVRFSSPLPNVIRIQLSHFKGRRERLPAFDLDYASANPAVSTGQNEQEAWLDAGGLSVVVPAQGQWRYAFRRDEQELTSSE